MIVCELHHRASSAGGFFVSLERRDRGGAAAVTIAR